MRSGKVEGNAMRFIWLALVLTPEDTKTGARTGFTTKLRLVSTPGKAPKF